MSPDYLPNLLGTLDRDGNADSNRSGGEFLGHIVPGNFGRKAAIMWSYLVKLKNILTQIWVKYGQTLPLANFFFLHFSNFPWLKY